MRSVLFAGLALWGSLAIGCKDAAPAKPTREECTKVAENIGDIILKEYTTNAEQWFDSIKAAPDAASSGLPDDLPRPAFKMWLDSPEGRTWFMKRRTNMMVGMQQGIDACVENATRAQVKCLLAAKTKEDVGVCDQKFKRKESEGSGSAPTAGSAMGADVAPPTDDKPFVPPPVPPNQMAPGEYGPAGTTGSGSAAP